MIPYAFAVVFTLIMCHLSDRYNRRALPALVTQLTAVIGLVILLATTNKIALMAGCCFVAAGSTPSIPIMASWLTNIHAGYAKKATIFAINMVRENIVYVRTKDSEELTAWQDLYSMLQYHRNGNLQRSPTVFERPRYHLGPHNILDHLHYLSVYCVEARK